MKVVILCGGYGTRIREVAEDIPKPMIPIGNFPILWHIMKYYAHWGHNRFVLCLGYKGQVIKDFFRNYDTLTRDFTVYLGNSANVHYHNTHSESDWEVTLAETGMDAMTGARIKSVQQYLAGDDNFMLTYGDGIGNVDLAGLIQFHLAHGKILTVTGVSPPGRFGELHYDSEGLITDFNEKPEISSGKISGGFFVCRKELFNYLNDRQDLVFEQEPMRRLVKERQLKVFQHNGFWHPMDTYRDYLALKGLLERGEAPWTVW